ncbi:hypothetical protein U1Q18_011785 [Sarracenia purpurea var. burkii]
MDQLQPDEGGESAVASPTPIGKGLEAVAKVATSHSDLGFGPSRTVGIDNTDTRSEVGKSREFLSSSIGASAMEISLEPRADLALTGQKSPTKISDVFIEALSIEGVQSDNGDNDEAEEDIDSVDLMIWATENDQVLANQKLSNLLEVRASSLNKKNQSGTETSKVSRSFISRPVLFRGGGRLTNRGRGDGRFDSRGGRFGGGPSASMYNTPKEPAEQGGNSVQHEGGPTQDNTDSRQSPDRGQPEQDTELVIMEGQGTKDEPFTPAVNKAPNPPPKPSTTPGGTNSNKKKKKGSHK